MPIYILAKRVDGFFNIIEYKQLFIKGVLIMKIVFKQVEKYNRYKHNKDILTKFRNGDSLSSFSNHNSWFPPRLVFKKNNNSLNLLKSNKVVLNFNNK